MKRSLSFKCRTKCRLTGELIDILVIFFGRCEIDITVIDDELQNALKTRDPGPDVVALLSFGTQAECLKDSWISNASTASGLFQRGHAKRMEYLKELAIWKFSGGTFQKIYRDAASKRDFQLDFENILPIGLAELVDKSGAYQEAPPGHVFKHPSKRETKHFLLASQLLREEVDAYFVALAICTLSWMRLRETETVHIDTMGIYPIARAVEHIARTSGGRQAEWTINNFHSHAGVNSLYEVVDDDEAVLISASTTGGMARSLVDEGVPEEAITTILEMSDQGRRGAVVYARSKYESRRDSGATSGGEAVIELAGEYFAATGKKPRTVILGIQHTPEALNEILENFSDSQACQLNRQRADGTSTVDLISISEAKVSENNQFRTWISEELRLKTPISVSHVIYVDGAGAKSMAEHCAQEIQKICGRDVVVLPRSEILSLLSTSCKGVVVCAPIVGDGHTLRALARDLREVAPKASRQFLIGTALPSSRESWRRLSLFLVQTGSKTRPYLLSAWKVLPTGVEQTLTAIQRADEIMQAADRNVAKAGSPWPEGIVSESLSALADALDKQSTPFLPTESSNKLALTDGFVYWNGTPEQRSACDHAAVSYLSMSSALQHAREFDLTGARLASSLHETVVLDTENFLRFNDGTLQASLLRAALPHELDYSSAPELSEMMREFLEKVFLNSSASYGEAALEFGLALASGQLRITAADKSRLLDVVSRSQTKPSVLVGLLYAWWDVDFLSRSTEGGASTTKPDSITTPTLTPPSHS